MLYGENKEEKVKYRRNINYLRYADDTILMAESEELKSFLMKVEEEREKAGLKLSIRKTKIMASRFITSWQIDGETMETVKDLIFLGSKVTLDGDHSHEIKTCLLLGNCESTALSMPANLENSAVAIGLEKVSFHSNAKECSSYHTTVLISYEGKIILKILQARL